jgi:Flp pilus assembly protein TadB
MHHLLGAYAGVMPTIALVIFVTVATLVTIYVVTDRRRAHHRRMEAMALDDGIPVADQKRSGGPHV